MIYGDYNIERGLLGALLMKNELIIEVDLQPEEFSDGLHQSIYERMQKRFAETKRFGVRDFIVSNTIDYLNHNICSSDLILWLR